MSGTNIRVIDLPDLGTVTDASSFVIDKGTATGRFLATAIKTYCATTTLPEAPFNNTPYGRMNGAWTPVLPEAPNNSQSYGRRGNAWSIVVPEAPANGQVYGRADGAWSQALGISGGTINGNLGVSGNFLAGNINTNQLAMASTDGYEWQFYAAAGTGNHVQAHRAGWYDAWESVGGNRRWGNPSGDQMVLDGSGALTVTAAIWQTINSFGFAPGGQGRKFFFGTQYYWEWNSTSGQLTWVSSTTPMWNMRATDGLCFNSVAAVGGVGPYLNSSDRRGKTAIAPSTKGLAEVLQLQPVSFGRVDASTGAQEEIGFIAQDVQPVLPEAVWTAGIPLRDGSGGLDSAEPMLALSESTIAAISVNAIKEIHTMLLGLTARVQVVEDRTP